MPLRRRRAGPRARVQIPRRKMLITPGLNIPRRLAKRAPKAVLRVNVPIPQKTSPRPVRRTPRARMGPIGPPKTTRIKLRRPARRVVRKISPRRTIRKKIRRQKAVVTVRRRPPKIIGTPSPPRPRRTKPTRKQPPKGKRMIPQIQKPGDKRAFVHKRLLRAAGGFLSGGPGGAVKGFFRPGFSTRPAVGGRGFRPSPITPATRRTPGSRRVIPMPGFRGLAQRIIPGGGTGLMVAGQGAGGGCPQGFHPNKSDYMTQAGFVAQGTKCVRNRRRNLSNGRAQYAFSPSNGGLG